MKKDKLKIANLLEPDSSIMNYVTELGYYLDGQGNAYQQRGGKFLARRHTILTYMAYLYL